MDAVVSSEPGASPPSAESPIRPKTGQGPPMLVIERTVLLVGTYTPGKSAFINGMARYFSTGKLPEMVVPTGYYEALDGGKIISPGPAELPNSQLCSLYDFQRGSLRYRFIETPRVSDTSARDIVGIIKAAAEQAIALHAIIWVIDASAALISPSIKRVLGSARLYFEDHHRSLFAENMVTVYIAKGSLKTQIVIPSVVRSFEMESTTPAPDQEGVCAQSLRTIEDLLATLERLQMKFTVPRDRLVFFRDEEEGNEYIPTEVEMREAFLEMNEETSGLKAASPPAAILSCSEPSGKQDLRLPSGQQTRTKRALAEMINSRNVLLLETGQRKSALISYFMSYFNEAGLVSRTVYPGNHDLLSCVTYFFQQGTAKHRFISVQSSSHIDESGVNVILEAIKQAGDLSTILLLVSNQSAGSLHNLRSILGPIAASYPSILVSNLFAIYANMSDSDTSLAAGQLPYKLSKSFSISDFSSENEFGESDNIDRFCHYLRLRISKRTIQNIISEVGLVAPKELTLSSTVLKQINDIKVEMLAAASQIEKQNLIIEILERDNQIGVEISAILNNYDVKQKIYASGALDDPSPMQLADLMSQLTVLKQIPRPIKRFYFKRQETQQHNTICRICKTTCHKGCSLDYTAVTGHNIFKDCACMSNKYDSSIRCWKCESNSLKRCRCKCQHLNTHYCKDCGSKDIPHCMQCGSQCAEFSLCGVCGCEYTTHVHDKCIFQRNEMLEGTTNEEIAADLIKRKISILHVEIKKENLAKAAEEAKESVKRYEELISLNPADSSENKSLLEQKEEARRKQQEAEKALITTKLEEDSILSQCTKAERGLQDALNQLETAQTLLESKCKELRNISPRRLFLEELDVTQQALLGSMSNLESEKSKSRVGDFVIRLDLLVDISLPQPAAEVK